MKRRGLIQHLIPHGYALIREDGNHSWWGNRRSAVPRHTEIPDLLAQKICQDLDVPKP